MFEKRSKVYSSVLWESTVFFQVILAKNANKTLNSAAFIWFLHFERPPSSFNMNSRWVLIKSSYYLSGLDRFPE